MRDNLVLIRKIKQSDRECFLNWWKNPELIRLTSGIFEKSDEVLNRYFQTMLKDQENFHFAICYKNELIGSVSLNCFKKQVIEISIVIGNSNYRGKGIGKIAIRKALKFAFKNTNCRRIVLEVRPENKRAIETYTVCGFKKIKIKGKDDRYIKMHLSREDFLL